MKIVSVVIPCYNEALNIHELYERLVIMFGKENQAYQIVFVENGSKDNSRKILADLSKKDPNVTVLVMSRNFGPQGAFTAGIDHSIGDGVVLMDGDLQDPPEIIPQFIKKWKEGYHIIYGVRTKREGSLFRRMTYKIFYRLMRGISYLNIPLDAGEFGLLDHRVVKVLISMPERDRFLRGLRAWTGFKHTGVPYKRLDRKHGETATSLRDNVHWALSGLFSFSYAPLQWISWLAFLLVMFSCASIIFYVTNYFIHPGSPQGFSTLIVVILFLGGMQLLCLSIIGQYIGRIFEEIKQRPIYVLEDILNHHSKLTS